MYVEQYVPPGDDAALTKPTQEALKALVDVALALSNLKALTGRDKPTVIT